MRRSGTPPFWEPGDVVLWRYQRKVPGYVGPETVRPMRVVRDDADGLVAWLAAGTPILRPVLADGRELRSLPAHDMFRSERAVGRGRWHGSGILKIAPTGAPWSAWLFREPGGAFRGWYVNLEDVHERDDRNVVTQDHVLDLWLTPDRSVRWKDADELAAAVETGRWSVDDADRFRDDARDVERLVNAWGPPFCDRWEDWRPPAAWPVPGLPADLPFDFDVDPIGG